MAKQAGYANIRGVGLNEICIIEKAFAFASIDEDAKEKIKSEKNMVFSLGWILEPKRTKAILDHIELEESLTEEDKELIRLEKTKVGPSGRVESDPEIQQRIREHKKHRARGRRSMRAIETLQDLSEDNGNA